MSDHLARGPNSRGQRLPGTFNWMHVLEFVGKDGQALRQVFLLSNDSPRELPT